MDSQARVGSIEALEAFRAALIRYTERSRRALDDVTGEVKRTRGWLEVEQRQKWEAEFRKRSRLLEQAEQELYSARMSSLRDDKTAQQMAVNKARRMLAEAEEKLAVLKRWRQTFDAKIEVLAKQLESLHEMLSRQMPKGVVSLTNSIRNLQDYAEVHVPREVTGGGEVLTEEPSEPS